MKNRNLMTLLGVLSICTIWGQERSTITIHADSLHQPFLDATKPGLAAAILHHDEVIYLSVTGRANPITLQEVDEHTLYNVGDLAKQFTTYALLDLIEEGVVRRTEPLRSYLPGLPRYANDITIDHLLNHTSGLNSIELIHQLLDGNLQLALEQEEALNLILLQKELAFVPGTDFSPYDSDTESILMASVVEKASGETFASYMKEHVFEPLGLEDARIGTQETLIDANLAWSYAVGDTGNELVIIKDRTLGASNVYLSIRDMVRWYTLLTTEEPIHPLVQQLDTPVRANDGKKFASSWGEMTLGRSFWHHERGIPTYWQFGLTGAYGANVFRFPEQDLIGIAMGNNNQYNGAHAMFQLEPLLAPHYRYSGQIEPEDLAIKQIPPRDLERWEGDYLYAENGQVRKIRLINDTLRYIRPTSELAIFPLGDNRFQLLLGSDDLVFFDFSEDDQGKGYTFTFGDGEPYRYTMLEENFEAKPLDTFVGTYVNSDLGIMARLTAEQDELILRSAGKSDIRYRPVQDNYFVADSWAIPGIKFDMQNDAVARFEVMLNGAFVRFEKVGLNK